MKTSISILISILSVSSFSILSCRSPEPPVLRIIKEDLVVSGPVYIVEGIIHNPSSESAENVVIEYEIWGKLKNPSREIRGIIEDGGLVRSEIKYLPPGQSVSFTARGQRASVMERTRGIFPDPLKAKITSKRSIE